MVSENLQNILKTLPQHLSKENTLKFYKCLYPIFEYLEDLLDKDNGMSNIDKAHGEHLDYLGFRNEIARGNRVDEEFRPFIKTARFKALNTATTENLIILTESLTGYKPSVITFFPKDEPASQYFKFIVPYTTDLSKFPDYNEIIDAGARMYRDIVSVADRRRYSPIWTAGLHQINMNIEQYEVNAGGRNG